MTFKLKAIIDSEPSNAGKTDLEILAWLKEVVTIQNDASNGDVLAWAGPRDLINRLRETSTLGSGSKRGLADVALTRINSGLGLTLSDSAIQGLLSQMVVDGTLTQQEVDALNESCQESKTRWSANNLQGMDDNSWLAHIGEARVQ